MRVAYALALSIGCAALASAGTYAAVNPMRATNLEQHAIIATFLEAYCNQKASDRFAAGASAALSVVAQRAGLGPITTAEAAKCIVMPPPSPEYLADLARAKFDADARKRSIK